MKLALLLFGISKMEYKHWQNEIFNIDYENSYDNYQIYIFNYFKNLGYEIDVYFCTNQLNEKDRMELINKYKPINYSFIKNETNKYYSRNLKFNGVIDLCLNNSNIYDLVLITRFDLLFQKKFELSNIQFDKFNLVSILEQPSFICDNFYLFPYKYLAHLSSICKRHMYSSFHYIKYEFDNINGKDYINYILNEYVCVPQLNFYKIVRNRIQG